MTAALATMKNESSITPQMSVVVSYDR